MLISIKTLRNRRNKFSSLFERSLICIESDFLLAFQRFELFWANKRNSKLKLAFPLLFDTVWVALHIFCFFFLHLTIVSMNFNSFSHQLRMQITTSHRWTNMTWRRPIDDPIMSRSQLKFFVMYCRWRWRWGILMKRNFHTFLRRKEFC